MDADWKRQLRREASAHGMCLENREALSSVDSLDDAVSLYKKTIDWALEEGYPNFGTLQRFFSDCGNLGVFVNREFHGDLLNAQEVYVFHHCSGFIRVGLNVERRIIPMLYFANGCDMAVKPGGPSNLSIRVPLYIFGNNVIKASSSGDVIFKSYNFDAK